MKLVGNIRDPKKIDIVIVIVTYNSARFMDRLIRSLFDQDFDLSRVLLIVVDNASFDETFEVTARSLERGDLQYVAVKLDQNVGFAPANNLAIRLLERLGLRPRAVVLLNPDTYIVSRVFLRAVDVLTLYLPIVGFATISGDCDIIDSLGVYIDMFGNPQDILSRVKMSEGLRHVISLLPPLYLVPSVCFAAVAIRYDVFRIMGLLRDDYVIYFEDTEFCLRAWSMGIPVAVYKGFMVWHMRGGTQKSPSPPKTRLDIVLHFSKNSLLLSYEYFGPHVYLLRALLYLGSGIVFRRFYLIRALVESIRLIKRGRLRWRRLPKGLISTDIRTTVMLWAVKYWLVHGDIDGAIQYGVKRASLEYIGRMLLKRRINLKR